MTSSSAPGRSSAAGRRSRCPACARRSPPGRERRGPRARSAARPRGRRSTGARRGSRCRCRAARSGRAPADAWRSASSPSGGSRPRSRDIAMVFQNYALYPHMTVRENLGYGLRVRKTAKPEIASRVERVAELLGLDELLDRRPAALSGGQRQRVAMGRAIVREPKAFLMDEPLSNLDAKLRVSMRAQLAALHGRLGTTTIYVTHDQVEAMTLGHRVAVMRDGRILQVDTPQALYASPRNLFVAAFIGSPAMNLVEADVGDGTVSFGGFRIPLSRSGLEGRLIVGIRPETFEDAALSDASLPQIDVDVE